MKNINKSWWYSVIMALLIIWFLLVLSTGVFNLILVEYKDNNAMWNYIKAYAWSESAQELALLIIKQNWYAYYDKIDHNINERSILLAKDPLNYSKFNLNKDVYLSYDIWSKTNNYDWKLEPLEYNIIPLFYVNELWEKKVTDIEFLVNLWNINNLSWNLIGKNNGISWKWPILNWVKKTLIWSELHYVIEEINSFISNSNTNYLVLFNTWNTWIIEYSLKSNNSDQYFSKPKTSIISSAEIGNYKQNLITDLDNTEFLNILKYSIFSN